MLDANQDALAAVPMMNELTDENLRQLMGGMTAVDDRAGRWPSVTCDCGCSICTSWIYACTK